MSTTIVNSPSPQSSGANGMVFLIGIVILVLFGAIFYFYGLPYFNQMSNQDIEVNVPATEINVPSDINITVDNPE